MFPNNKIKPPQKILAFVFPVFLLGEQMQEVKPTVSIITHIGSWPLATVSQAQRH